jgi:hypothetical protein
VTLISVATQKLVAQFNVREMRCFSRHRDHRNGKPKFISIMASNRYNNDPTKEYQCFMFHIAQTAQADSFCYMLNYVCQELHRRDLALGESAVAPPHVSATMNSPARPLIPKAMPISTPSSPYGDFPAPAPARPGTAPPVRIGWS